METKAFAPNRSTEPRGAILAAGGIIVFAALAAYHGSFSGPFIFDDIPSIVENATLRHLWPLGSLLSSDQGGLTTSGRPVLSASFALNYALGGTRVWGYHAVNLAIHILAGLTLFGIARRTLAKEKAPLLLAFSIALIWTVHPLLTESVTYIVQRAESLMGLFYLLTLYCFIRNVDAASRRVSPGTRRDAASTLFQVFSVAACLLGMATKEVMVSAPLMVLLYDRTFVAGSFRAAWRGRRAYYLSLAATWLLLIYLVGSTHDRGGTAAGVDADASAWSSHVTAWNYWLTQFPAVMHYLALAAWPHPLVLDYGMHVAQTAAGIVPSAAIVLGLAVATAIGLRRRPAWGFLGFFFFAILAPTSLVPVVVQTMAEHRMYLALAPVVAAAVLLADRLLAWVCDRAGRGEWAARCCCGCCLVAAAGYGFMTARRNEDYRSEVAIWQATVAARPDNARAQYILGIAYRNVGDYGAAIARARESLRLQPDSAEAQNNWAAALAGEKRWPEAIAHYEEALRLAPDLVKIRNNLGIAFFEAGRLPEAIATDEEVLREKPDYAKARYNLDHALLAMGDALADAGRNAEAAEDYAQALQLEPNDVKTRGSLGAVFIRMGRVEQAAEQFAAASRLQPDNAGIHNILGITLAKLGRTAEAVNEFETALRLKPDDAEIRANLAQARSQQGRN